MSNKDKKKPEPQDNSKPVILTGKDAEDFKKQHDKSMSILPRNAVVQGKPTIGRV